MPGLSGIRLRVAMTPLWVIPRYLCDRDMKHIRRSMPCAHRPTDANSEAPNWTRDDRIPHIRIPQHRTPKSLETPILATVLRPLLGDLG